MSKLRTLALTVLFGLCAFSNVNAKSIILTSPEDYQVIDVSPNGKWACGVYVDYSYAEFAFLWNLESGTITMLSSSTESEAYSVSNDGVVVGRFADGSFSKNGITVDMPGYYKDGEWHSVEYPEGTVPSSGEGHGISTDGHYMSGQIDYVPYIWKDGKIYRRLGDGVAQVYDISPDGQSATGWEYGPVHNNRIPTYWKADGSIIHINDYESMFAAGKRFSPDGKKILFFGGWDGEVSNLFCIYDIETGAITKYPTLVKDADMDVFDINSNGTFVGYESGTAYINKDGQGHYAYDYLTGLGVDFSDTDILFRDGKPVITRAQALSEDEGVIVLLYYDSEYAMRSMVVMPNRDGENLAPVEIKAAQMDGIASARITWKEPLGANEITGYNVYRGGTKLNTTPVTTLYYYDAAVGYGSYDYSVAAVYGDGTEKKSDAVSVTLSDKGLSQPQAVYTRQKGVNSAFVQWEAPASNLITKTYTDISTANLQGFGINTSVNFEPAIRFAKDEVACYAGCKLTQVSFYPMSEQAGWAINIYTRDDNGSLKLITSQKVTQELTYRAKNTVKLDTPVSLPDGDLIVAVEVSTSKVSNSIIGMDYGTVDAGNSDLLRQVGEDDDFYSLYEMSRSNGYPYVASWMIDAVFAPEGSSDDVDVIDHYNVYADNNKVGETQGNSYEIADMTDGTHTVGVDAVYSNGQASAISNGSVEIAKRYAAIDDVTVTHDTNTGITATWSAPADKDATEITYSSKEPSGKGARAPQGYTLMAGVIYTPAMLKGYDGYQIKTFKFHPHSDALYTFYLIKDETTVCELEVNDYELDQWNTVKLKTPITIDETATYQLVLDCYDVASDEYGLSVDNTKPLMFYSDLYSLDGSSWNSLDDAAIHGNWMMGMDIAAPDGKTLDVDGYDVLIDGVKQNTDLLKTTSFAYDFGTEDATRHSVSVDVYYPAKSESVEGGATYFYIGAAGIGNVEVATLNLRQGDNYLKVEGSDVKSMVLFTVNGMRMSSVTGDTMSLSGIGNGVYVVKVVTKNGTMTRKIKVVK